jgi:concanavalin A-like lectin/glucanase superfamily protein
MIGRYIDLGNPVSDHPLNRGLLAWFLPLPGAACGAARLFSLVGGHNGQFVNGPGVTRGPGELLGVRFDGDDDHLTASFANLLATRANTSLFCWVFTATGTTSVWGERSADTPIWKLEIGNTNMRFTHRDDSGTLSQLSAGPSLTDSQWHHIGITKAGTSLVCYHDGINLGTQTINGNDTLTVSTVWIGGDSQDAAADYQGVATDWRAYNRTLADSEVALLHDQTSQGHPDTLRRFSRRTWLTPVVTPSSGRISGILSGGADSAISRSIRSGGAL